MTQWGNNKFDWHIKQSNLPLKDKEVWDEGWSFIKLSFDHFIFI